MPHNSSKIEEEKSDILSLKSDQLNDELRIIKRKNEQFAYIICIITQFLWALQGIQLKTYHIWYPEIYNINTFVFWRNIIVSSLGYFMCIQKNIKIKKINEIKFIYWFYVRNIGIYIAISVWMAALTYLRLSTCQIFAGICPLLTIIISIIILGDKFYSRYLYGMIICFIGSSIIILNERNPEVIVNNSEDILNENTNINNINDEKIKNIFLGIICLLSNVTVIAFGNVAQKKMCIEKLTPEVQTFYFGLFPLIISFFCCLFNFNFGFSNLKYCFYCMSNGIIFYAANYLTSVSFKYIEISKLMPVTYLNLVIVFFFGSFLFHEKIFFSDVIGASLIVGFIVYNGMYPPRSKIINNNQNFNEKLVE
jgi:drug/metabolite transporter (DMT)-like permease